jgi:hypothetical protein
MASPGKPIKKPPTLDGSAVLISRRIYGITTIVPCIIAPWIRQ